MPTVEAPIMPGEAAAPAPAPAAASKPAGGKGGSFIAKCNAVVTAANAATPEEFGEGLNVLAQGLKTAAEQKFGGAASAAPPAAGPEAMGPPTAVPSAPTAPAERMRM